MIASGATWFIFGIGTKQASNRNLTISQGGNAYLFDNATVSFQGSVNLTNAGTFTAYDAVSIGGTGSDSFTNNGTLNCGGVNGGACALNLPFYNNSQVNIQSGTLTLLTGSSSGTWSIGDSAALILAGGGTGATAQVFLFQTATSLNGQVIVDGANDGGLGVQNDGALPGQTVQPSLSINQLYLVAGTISGFGLLTVTGQMVWSGGTMTSAANPTNATAFGSTTIAQGAALFLMGMQNSSGQPITPVLARPLNILGRVGWVGNDGSVSVTLFPQPNLPTKYTNPAAMLASGGGKPLADIPAASGSLLGGYGHALYLASVLHTVLLNPSQVVTFSGPWGATVSSLAANSVTAFFQELPAIERASVAAAFALRYGTALATFIKNNVPSQAEANCNTLFNGLPSLGAQQFAAASPLAYLQMAGGVLAGIAIGALNGLAGVGTVVYQVARLTYLLITSPVATVQAIASGLSSLWTKMQDLSFREAAAAAFETVFPNLMTAYQLYSEDKLVSYAGGEAIGQAVSRIVVQAAIVFFTGGAGNLISLSMRFIIKGVKVAAPIVGRTAAALAKPVVTGLRASNALLVAMGNNATAAASALGNKLATPLNAVRRRFRDATGRSQIVSAGVQGAVQGTARPLTPRQRWLLSQLTNSESQVIVSRGSVSMRDLRNLTLHTGDEFAILTRRGERLILRGVGGSGGRLPSIPQLSVESARRYAREGWRFSGHTHTPGFQPVGSAGDKNVLQAFGQRRSAVWGATWSSRPGVFYWSLADEINARLGIR